MRYTIWAILFAFATLTSCIDDELFVDSEIPEGIREGYSLSLKVTLDKMGGTRAIDNALTDIEDYIDTEKFRVLFFDSKEKFLFESKSRWVKKLDSGSGNAEWLVSVPIFTYGNDIYEIDGKKYEWDWEDIRTALTTGKFKIAVLANRPELDWYPAFTDTEDIINAQWYDNRGPFWTPLNARGQTDEKKIFDLHHCQYDPMYHGKSTAEGYYDFIMGNGENWKDNFNRTKFEPTLSATSSWVYWGSGKGYDGVSPKDYDADFPSESKLKYTVLPTEDYPIPMYGIQEFDPINDWTKGTTVNLSTTKSIALLRSVVKLELRIPKTITKPKFVAMWYPNIYARCEPMDIWTPTDQIWEENHENDCEWNAIMNYGPFCSREFTTDGTSRYTDDASAFKKIMSWYYGAWGEDGPDGNPRWDWNGVFSSSTIASKGNDTPYPRIFNPCIQRNKLVICNVKGDVSDRYNDDYWHFVVYTGERNMTDPNTIPQMKSSHAYAVSWMFKDEETGKYYCFPIADYETNTDNKFAQSCFGPYTADDIGTGVNLPDGDGTQGDMFAYGDNLREVTTRDEMPWPLLRNHVYQLTISEKKKEPIILSWSTSPTLSGNANNIATWTGVDKNNPTDAYSITTANTHESGNILTTEYGQYKTIKASAGVTNTLTLPQGKTTKKITLYSYINKAGTSQTLIQYHHDATTPTGIEFIQGGSKTAEISSVSVTSGATKVNAFKFNGTGQDNGIKLTTTGEGFKKGDKVEITGVYNDGSQTRELKIALYTKSGDHFYKAFSTQYLTNGSNNTEAPSSETFILQEDSKELLLTRVGGASAYITDLVVTRPTNSTETYWNEVNGTTVTNEASNLHYSYQDYQNPDIHEFTFENPQKQVTFTNTGENVYYVVAIEAEDETPSNTRATGNEDESRFTVKSKDLHSKSIRFD